MAKLYISLIWNNLDPGFSMRIFSKLFKAPSPLSKLRSTKAYRRQEYQFMAYTKPLYLKIGPHLINNKLFTNITVLT